MVNEKEFVVKDGGFFGPLSESENENEEQVRKEQTAAGDLLWRAIGA